MRKSTVLNSTPMTKQGNWTKSARLMAVGLWATSCNSLVDQAINKEAWPQAELQGQIPQNWSQVCHSKAPETLQSLQHGWSQERSNGFVLEDERSICSGSIEMEGRCCSRILLGNLYKKSFKSLCGLDWSRWKQRR